MDHIRARPPDSHRSPVGDLGPLPGVPVSSSSDPLPTLRRSTRVSRPPARLVF